MARLPNALPDMESVAKKRTMKYVGYIFIRIGVVLMAVTPFFVLYLLSDGLYFLLRHLLGYRRKVVEGNLKKVFPEKSAREIEGLISLFYRNLCDIVLEGIKGLSMSEDDFRKRYIFEGTELADSFHLQSRSTILTGAHITNWEWMVISVNLWFKTQLVGIYKPISNPFVEAYLNRKRGKFGLQLASPKETRAALTVEPGQSKMFILLADQSPSNLKSAHWLPFFGVETAWLHGIDSIARDYNFPVFYYNIERIRRGYYHIKLEPLCLEPTTTQPQDITKMYIAHISKELLKQPANWLWSHKRWKHLRSTQNTTI